MKLSYTLLAFSLVLLSTFSISKVECKSAFDYQVIFRAGSLYCLFDFPDEAHKGDTYNYELNVTAEATVQITTFEMNVFYWDAAGEHMQTYNIANYILMNDGENFVRTIQFTVPSTILWDTIYVNFYIHTDEVTNFFLGVFTTNIVDKTRSELLSENYDLQYNYTNLKNEYENYKSSHSYSNSEYNALNSTYNQYVESHSYANTEYDDLQSRYGRELGIAQTLNYVMIVIAVVFIASTVYFARRKPGIKSVSKP